MKVPRARLIMPSISFALVFFADVFFLKSVSGEELGLTGTERLAFVEGTVGGCLNTQHEEASRAGIPYLILSNYCHCVANGIADRISSDDMKIMSNVNPNENVWVQLIKEAAAKPCLAAAAKNTTPLREKKK